MDLYTSIASIIAFVVAAIIIWLIGPRPPEATVGSEDASGNAARQLTVHRSVVSNKHQLGGPTKITGSIPRPSPLRGFLHGQASKKPLKSLVVVARPSGAL
jgi:hypothetical protein